MQTLLFVYGTLKQGCSNHRHLAAQTRVAVTRTVPGFRLFDLGGYPGMVPVPTDTEGVVGEVWSVDADALRHLDHFEGVHEGLYRREPIRLVAPFDDQPVDAYLPAKPIHGHPEVGAEWIEPRR